MSIVPHIFSAIALISPFIAVWLSHRKLRTELAKLPAEVESLRLHNDEARAAERKRVRSYADAVDVLTLGFDPWGGTRANMTSPSSSSIICLTIRAHLTSLWPESIARGPTPSETLSYPRPTSVRLPSA